MYLLYGQVLGVKSRSRIDRETGEEIVTYMVGIQSDKPGGYDGEMITQDVTVTKKQMQKGLQAHYEKIRGQVVYCPVFAQAWKSRAGNVNISWYFDDEGYPVKPQPVEAK